MSVNTVASGTASHIAGAIRQAANSTGASFEYLLTTAQIESNLNPGAQASTSSAKGLYQFIQQTWLATMKSAGPALGYGRYASAIVQNPDGTYDVPDANMRNAIMSMRSDVATSSMMAGAFATTNAGQLSSALGRSPTEGELYIAHFLGSDGAAKLINAAANRQPGSAADQFPQAASANQTIFYDRSGRARTASEVYGALTSRYEVARAVAFSPSLQAISTRNAAQAPDTAGVTAAFAQANDRMPHAPDTRPLFQSMFTDRARALTSTVSDLWGQQQGGANADQTQGRRLNLFTDQPLSGRRTSGGKV